MISREGDEVEWYIEPGYEGFGMICNLNRFYYACGSLMGFQDLK